MPAPVPSRRARRLTSAWVAALVLAGASAASAQAQTEFADVTTLGGGAASGTLAGTSVQVTGTEVLAGSGGSVSDGSATTFDRPAFTPRVPTSDVVAIIGRAGSSYTLRFGAPVTDPVLHLGSLASRLSFPAGTGLTKLSGDAAFVVSGATVTGAVDGSTDASGTVRVSGTFTTLTVGAEPVFAGRDGIDLLPGAPSAAVFADLTEVEGTQARGTLDRTSFAFGGPGLAGGTVLDGTSGAFSDARFTPALATSDAVAFRATGGQSHTVAFGRRLTDPVLHLASLAARLEFPAGTVVHKVSGPPGLTVSGTTVSGTPGGVGGTIRLVGSLRRTSVVGSALAGGPATDDALLLVGAPAAVPAASEAVDPAFNGGLPQEVSFSSSDEFVDVLVDGRGRTSLGGQTFEVVNDVGTVNRDGLLARLRPDGSPDGAFGGGDGFTRPDPGDAATLLRGVLRDPQGRLGAGFLVPGGAADRVVAGRFGDAGGPDGSFDGDGFAFADATATGDGARLTVARVEGGADGSTTFIGDQEGIGSAARGRVRVVRLDASGRLDATFGTAGRASVAIPSAPVPSGRRAPNVTGGNVLPDGRVLVTGRTYDADGRAEAFLMRLTSTGQPDATFGGAGDGTLRVQADTPGGAGDASGSQANAVAVAPDGSLYVVGELFEGSSSRGAVTFHVSAGGVVDPAFGIVRTPASAVDPSGRAAARGSAVAVQSDGKPLVAITTGDFVGTSAPGTDYSRAQLALVRFTATGALDAGFAGDGVALERRVGSAVAREMAIAPGGKVVVAGASGTASDGTPSAFAARYLVQDAGSLRLPEALRDPVVSGTPSPGSTLSCAPAEWSNSPTSIEVLWERAPRGAVSDDDPSWGPIGGAAGRSYTLTGDDLGSRVRCREVAANADGSATAPSASKRVDAGIPTVVRAPAVTGTPVVGNELTCDVGDWTGGPDFAVQWYREVSGPIAGATNRTYVPRDNGQRQQIGCEVTASNDVGAAAPVRTAPTLVFNAPPRSLERPVATLTTQGFGPGSTKLACAPGRWEEDLGQYEYRWRREGAEIAGETQPTYTSTVADLGRLVACEVFSTNPAGRSEGGRSEEVLVPLPGFGSDAKVYGAGGFNRYDPRNFMALSGAYLEVIRTIATRRVQEALIVRSRACAALYDGTPPQPPVPTLAQTTPGRRMSAAQTCGVLRGAFETAVAREDGAYFRGGRCSVPADDTTDLSLFSAPRCPRLQVDVTPIDPARPPVLDMADQARLEATKPLEVLWDFNRDGRTDLSCDPDAPVARSLFNSGSFSARAVIITEAGIKGGIFPVGQLDFTHQGSGNGTLRPAQPFACRASIEPPAEENLPCVPKLAVGRMRLEGNLCPISLRRIPEREIEQLPADLQGALADQAFNAALRRAPVEPEGFAFGATLRATPGQLAYDTASQVNALSTLGGADAPVPDIPKKWDDSLKAAKGFAYEKKQFALDQIYLMAGRTKVNGVDVIPNAGTAAVLIPSDAGEAIDSVKKMRLSASNAATQLSGLPLGDPALIAADLADRAGVTPPTLKDVNLDGIAARLKSKLDLGPFKLAGRTKVRLADDGTAFLEAQAELPSLLTKPGSTPIRTAVKLSADLQGRVKLQGVRLRAKSAYLAALKIADLDLEYDGGLTVKGKLLFPPLDEGISINRFRLDERGRFRELDVDYLAGRGQGIGIGPGLFLTKVGGGLSLDPDEIRARATISVGPSATGGGCPTAGIEAGFVVHFAPGLFFVRADGTVSLLCIPLANASFYADQTGAVDLKAAVKLDLGPLFFEAGFGGTFRLPRWQIEARGKGGIRGLIEAEVKLLVGSLGIAGCGRVEIFPETPLTDSVTIAAGAGIRFSDGRPPLSFPELVGNVRVFTGCDLTKWSPFGRDVGARAAQAGGGRTFTVRSPAPKVLALEVFGRGGPPKVRLRSPSGKLLDASAFGERLTKGAQLSGLTDPANARTVLFVRGEAGRWTLEPAEGSPPITDLRSAEVLPAPRVSARVGGAGAARTLRYRVAPVAGQEVQFVEHSTQGSRIIKRVKRGGRGTVRFTTSEGRGTKRFVEAEVVQDGMPRENVLVARFSAPPPRPGRPARGCG